MAKLMDLKVADLRRELEERDCDTTGKKADLQERLRNALREEGDDPDNFVFNGVGDVNLMLQSLKSDLLENSAMMEEKLMGNSARIEEKLMENSANLKSELLENSANLKSELLENSAKVEEKLRSELNKKILETSELEEKLLEKLEGRIQQVQSQFATLDIQTTEDRHRRSSPDNQGESEVVPIRMSTALEVNTQSASLRMKPPQFDGTTSWNIYQRQFEAAAKANGWSSRDKATALTLALRGDAAAILQRMSPAEQDVYEELVRHLEMRYGQTHLEHVYHSQLKNRFQKPGESLQEFEADIARLVRLAYPDAQEKIMERLAVQAFLDGLRDTEMRQALLLAHPPTLVDALTRALEFEAAKNTTKGQTRVRKMAPGDDEFEESVKRICKDLIGERRGPGKLECWKCGKLGHVRRRCPDGASMPSNSEN